MFSRDFNLQEKQHLLFLQLYLTFHSYGQYVLYPWGYARRDTPDRNDLHSLGLKGAQAAKNINGRRYSVGTAAKMLYPAAGKKNVSIKPRNANGSNKGFYRVSKACNYYV